MSDIVRTAGPRRDPGWITGRLTARIRAISDRLFDDMDTTAIVAGWETTTGGAGLTRMYRDSRFDSLGNCPSCQGEGTDDDLRCGRCSGTGRVVIGQRSTSSVGRAR